MAIKKLPSIITKDYFLANAPIGKNFNADDIYQYFNISENLYIVPIIGQDQYDELIEQVTNNSVSPENSTLLLKLYPLLSYAITYQALPFLWTNIAEVGITLGKSDNSDSIQLKDISYISTRLESTISTLKRQLIDWLAEYIDTFPMVKEWWSTSKCDCSPFNNKDITHRSQIYSPRKQPIDIR